MGDQNTMQEIKQILKTVQDHAEESLRCLLMEQTIMTKFVVMDRDVNVIVKQVLPQMEHVA